MAHLRRERITGAWCGKEEWSKQTRWQTPVISVAFMTSIGETHTPAAAPVMLCFRNLPESSRRLSANSGLSQHSTLGLPQKEYNEAAMNVFAQ